MSHNFKVEKVATILFLMFILTGCSAKIKKATEKITFLGYSPVPKLVINDHNWEEINAGFTHTCGIKTDGSLWCWGNNQTGQIGDGTTTNHHSPLHIGKPCSWLRVSLSDHYTCAIRSDRSIWCWGEKRGRNVPLCDNNVMRNNYLYTSQSNSKQGSNSQSGLTFSDISIGDAHICGLTAKGTIYCWGLVDRLGLGRNKFNMFSNYIPFVFYPYLIRVIPPLASFFPKIRSIFLSGPLPIDTSKIQGEKAFKNLTVGSGHSCGITVNGKAYCWGRNDRGQAGSGATYKWILSPSPVNTSRMTGSKIFKNIIAGTYHTCSIMTDGVAYCWGANEAGQLGIGNFKDQKIPVRLDVKHVRGNKEFILISGGFAHSCGITKDHVAYCWGEYVPVKCEASPDNGRCPLPAQLDTSEVGGSKRFKWISAGCAHACAVSLEGNGYCWGNNEDGRLGIGLKSNHK